MIRFYKGVALLLISLLSFQAHALTKSVGTKTMGMAERESFTVPTEGVKSVAWLLPHGFKIESGQGTGTIVLQSSFLAQDGKLSAARLFEDGHKDTLSYQIQVYRKVDKVEDHTINEGQEIYLAGAMRNKADIYYEQTGEMDGRPLYTAHRLTVLPPNNIEFSQPVLQTITANSVWVTWKTSSLQPSKVSYAVGTQPLNNEAEGSAEKLGVNYYWHSVELKDLQPNTTYSYKITSGGSPETYRFHTPPVIGSKQKMRILLMGDHQIKTRSGYEWLFQAAKRKVEERYGDIAENIQMIMNVGDQVDVGTLQQYEQIHLYKSKLLSPYLPTMTVIGNHETYSDPGMKTYAAHYHYENLSYKGITSGTENYYAYQVGRVLFVSLSTEHAGNDQKAWVQKVADEAKNDETVDFIISVNHRPIQAEQYIGDISAWVRNEIVPILNTTGKHVLNFGGHHHLYHRGQKPEAPLYHIINGGASWNQLWGMSSEQDFDDVQKTIDYWGYQILEFTYDDAPKMTAECYAIGNKDIVRDNLLIDTFHRQYGQPAPKKPSMAPVDETVTLPYTFKGSQYESEGKDPLNTVEYQISTTEDFSSIVVDNIRDVEDLYGSTRAPLHIPVDVNENVDITQLTIPENRIKNGTHYVRVRYRDANLEWSEWSDVQKFTVTGSVDGDPIITMGVKRVDAGESFTVDYNYAPVGKNAWIGIYHKGQKPGPIPSTTWAYTQGVSGTMKFTLPNPDEYFAVLFQDGGYKEAAPRVTFFVGPEVKYSIDKKVYEEGEPVTVTYTNAPALKDDWFGVYRMGETPGSATDYSDSWSYINKGQADGLIKLATGSGYAYKLPKGYYFISYFSRGEYFEPFERQYFSVGS
ncbi:MAG: fibronectin type III domain-containing protein, partial [Prevotella sp.]